MIPPTSNAMKNGMNRLGTFRSAAIAIVLGMSLSLANAQETPTPPVGYVTLHVAAGNGVSKTITALSAPLYGYAEGAGQLTGQITGVSANSLSNSSAGWTPGELSQPATPFVIKLTSGAATGRTFLISTTTANTATTVTLDAKDVAQGALTSLGIAVGDGYEIFPCDTLSSLFGTPETTGVEGGTSATNADSLMIAVNGVYETYYYNTNLNRWAKAMMGNPDATYVPLRPDSGILYSRRAASILELTLSGRVPMTGRTVEVKDHGVTLLSQNWPVDITLLASGIQNIPTWTSAPSAAAADQVQIIKKGAPHTYWFNGTSWRKQQMGFPLADGEIIPAGSAVIIDKKGGTTEYRTLHQSTPYDLE
ncbi:MAG TPA: hypothetical protein VNQ90_10520 [Chthoniobacteraceae bacterium]|nr:hypothetical protein [Chthoniobacteraceae bacterium]